MADVVGEQRQSTAGVTAEALGGVAALSLIRHAWHLKVFRQSFRAKETEYVAVFDSAWSNLPLAKWRYDDIGGQPAAVLENAVTGERYVLPEEVRQLRGDAIAVERDTKERAGRRKPEERIYG